MHDRKETVEAEMTKYVQSVVFPLVCRDSKTLSGTFQSLKRFKDAGIGLRLQKIRAFVAVTENRGDLLQNRSLEAVRCGKGVLDRRPDEGAQNLLRQFAEAESVDRISHGAEDPLRGIQKRSVKIKNDQMIVFHFLIPKTMSG